VGRRGYEIVKPILLLSIYQFHLLSKVILINNSSVFTKTILVMSRRNCVHKELQINCCIDVCVFLVEGSFVLVFDLIKSSLLYMCYVNTCIMLLSHNGSSSRKAVCTLGGGVRITLE